jgi:heme-based aerotactic transducer
MSSQNVAIDADVRATVTGDDLLDGLGIDDAEIARRKRYTRFDEGDAARLEAMADDLGDATDAIVADFYDHIASDPEVEAILERSSMPEEALVAGQHRYLNRLVGGEYGRDYFGDRARVGRLHDLLGLEPDAYLGQYSVYYEGVFDVLADRAVASVGDEAAARGDDAVALGDDAAPRGGGAARETDAAAAAVETFKREALSVLKAFLIDQQLAIDTYVDSYAAEAEREARRQRELASDVSERIAGPAESLRETTGDVAAGSDRIAALAGEQSDRMNELSREANEMTATVEEVAATADDVATTSDDAADLAAEGVDAAADAVAAMDEIDEATASVRAEMDRLQERVDDIRGVTDVIADVADQTNLLALNASIEAARAGEAGAGFAVVADEVKSLAQDTSGHAAAIETTVDEMAESGASTVAGLERTVDRVDEGTERVDEALDRLEAIERAVADASDGVAEVSAAMDSQAASVEEVAAMVDESADSAGAVADRASAIATATDEQRERVGEIADSASSLAD